MRHALLVSLLTTLFGIGFGPLLVTTAWHWRYGNFVKCADKEILVPLRWYPTVELRSVSLVKLAPTIFTDHIIKAYVGLSPLSQPAETRDEIEELYKGFASTYWTKLTADRDVVEGPIRIGAGTNEAFCMQSFPRNNKNWFHDMCIVFHGTWSADFQGGEEDRKTF